jgi:hypothetical protein
MQKKQAEILHSTALAFLEKAQLSVKASDAKVFYDLAADALERSCAILAELRKNSLLMYWECCVVAPGMGNWGSYLDFCARNSLQVLAKEDFDAFLARIL